MTRIVNEELTHIPRIDKHNYDGQAQLRVLYNGARRQDLKLGKTKEQTLAHCIDCVKKDLPNWQPMFDQIFFQLP
ncbi:MAG: hypothetical protein ACLP5V_16130 [Candidatus Bathyarchaeia archaeon]